MVALDSAVILNPQVWVASGHVGGFSDPMVDCRTCKLRFRADHLAQSACGKRPSKHPGEYSECDLTEPRDFNLMFETYVGAVREAASTAYLRPETAQGIFVNFKNVTSSLRVKPPFGIAQIGKSFRNEITPGNFLFRVARVRADGDGVLRPAGRRRRVAPLLDRPALQLAPRPRRPPVAPARPRARRRRAVALLERDERHRVPLPDRLAGARGRCEPRRLRPPAAHRGVGHEARVDRARGAVRPVRDRAGDRRRPRVPDVPVRRLRRGGRRRASAHGAAPASTPRAREGRRAAADRQGRRDGREGAPALRGPAPLALGGVRRLGGDRQALPPPGRDRHPVGVDDRRADRRGRHGHAARPRHARAGARRRSTASRQLLLDRLEQPWHPRA